MPELEEMSVEELIAVADHDADAQVKVGQHYLRGTGGVEKDTKKALGWFIRAAVKGHIWALFMLGRYFVYGFYVPQDFSAAVELFQLSADNGNSSAQAVLDLIHIKGQDVPKDEGMHEMQNKAPDKPGTILAHESQPVKEGAVADVEETEAVVL